MCVFLLRPMRKYIYIFKCGLSASARRTACVGLMWVQRRRHWSSIGRALDRISRLMCFQGR